MPGVGLTVCVSNKGLCSIVTENRKTHWREAMRGTFTKMFNKILQRIKSLTPTDLDNKQKPILYDNQVFMCVRIGI